MRFYSAPISVIDGQKVYGNLPPNFATGHELNGTAYIMLPEKIEVLDEYGITEIDEPAYATAVNTLQTNEKSRRQKELTDFEQKKTQKELLKEQYKQLKATKGKPTTIASTVERLEKLEEILGL